MSDLRIISRLDIKGDYVIKGYQMEGLRKIGNPKFLASHYFSHGIDEIVIIDVVASLYKRDQIIDLINFVSSDFFIPLTVIGGVKCLANARELFNNGADKVGVNTAALQNPEVLRHISDSYGSQSLVLSIEAKQHRDGKWYVYGNSGRTNFQKLVTDWIEESLEYGVGEILLTSIDKDGTNLGFDLELLKSIVNLVPIPLIISGGISQVDHVSTISNFKEVDGIAIGRAFHENLLTIDQVKLAAIKSGRKIRVVA